MIRRRYPFLSLVVLLLSFSLSQSVSSPRKRRKTVSRGHNEFHRTRQLKKGKGKGASQGKGKKYSVGNGRDGEESVDEGSYDSVDNIFDDDFVTTIQSEESFVTYCRSGLLSGGVTDGLVSQDDVAAFISDICDILDDEDLPQFHCPQPQFANLDVAVQLSFVWYICPHESQGELVGCLSDLGIQQGDFGYDVSSASFVQGLESTLGFCCSLLPFTKMTGITPLPAESTTCPTNLPDTDLITISARATTMPTQGGSITRSPTGIPTGVPTLPPSTPTQAPADATPSPSPQPSKLHIDDSSPISTLVPTAPSTPTSLYGSSVEQPTVLTLTGTVTVVLSGALIVSVAGLLVYFRRHKNVRDLSEVI